jgi:hypothetical protein
MHGARPELKLRPFLHLRVLYASPHERRILTSKIRLERLNG